jgi:DNA invertase Pin-like site-specific DNA recombinase
MTMSADLLPVSVLQRTAIVYVRQSTQMQVQTNLESQRRQYELAEVARGYGFKTVDVIDDDLGRSASGNVARPGFERLVAGLCSGNVGAIFCLEPSRPARNGRDWHHVLELCGLVEARVIDPDGIYDPCRPNDRLLLGMKGSISEFELGILHSRMIEAARSKARRGELRYTPPIGFIWHREIGLGFDPDIRVQEVIHLIFRKFRELGSARQVLLWMSAEKIHFPRPSDGIRLVSFEWRPVRYRNVIGVLKNPFYAGVYGYGKTGKRAEVIDGRAHVTYKNRKALEDWDVLLKNHHEGYIDWPEFERNQVQLSHNAYGTSGGTKSGRGGGALLVGVLSCARCGRRLRVVYAGRKPRPVYRCDNPNLMLGEARCLTFGGARVEEAVAVELLRAVKPVAIAAALEAKTMVHQRQQERLRVAELDLEKARYEASLAERRYAACDPDNRLIAAQLEKSWETALRRVQTCQQSLEEQSAREAAVEMPDLSGLAEDLKTAWEAPRTTMRVRQRLVRALVEDIMADVDGDAGEIVLVIHWKGGQHSTVRVRKPKTGEHGCTTSADALAVIRSMAGRWSDDHIAASLNRMGMPTGQNKTWNAKRVSSIRRVNGINAYFSADKDGEWCTMLGAANELGVTSHVIRRLIKEQKLTTHQVVPGAPHQIRRSDLKSETVTAALGRKGAPCRDNFQNQLPMFPDS